MRPRRIIALGVLICVLSGVGLAVVLEMRPMTLQPEFAAWNEIFGQRWRGEISRAEADRRMDALDIGLGGWMLRHNVYPVYLSGVCGGILAGLVLIGTGAVRARRRRSIVSAPR